MKFDVVRAWKDAEYRQSLSEQEQLPMSPVGAIELSEAELDTVYGAGGGGSSCGGSCGCGSNGGNGGSGSSGSASSKVSAINSLSALACVNSTALAGFCVTYGVNCELG